MRAAPAILAALGLALGASAAAQAPSESAVRAAEQEQARLERLTSEILTPFASEAEFRRAFAAGWEIESVEPARFEVRPGIPGAEFTPGGARAWFATVRRA